ncbi:hypothetical protein [Paenibacillus xylanivorans]|uniref:Uncharacterized protein n=1 Tax=Paenibacillus xylanivorans TaxID=1705561 RepID=A0A0N0C3C1_9BACL|nr:hypothetical protein [Paenibacillus xylanivorans]KOY14121.1 hypothetical protein AMS66_23125 [Paenibacillus xylanivorans]
MSTNFISDAYVTGWTPAETDDLQDTWIEISLLFLTADIENRMGQLKEEHKSFLWITMEEFSKGFKNIGVFSTNEATDGRALESLINGGKKAYGNLMREYYLKIRLLTVLNFLLH